MPPSHPSPFVTEEAPRTDAAGASPWPVAPPPARATVDPLEPEVFASWGLGPEQFAAYVSPAARALHVAVSTADAPSTGSAPGVDEGAWEGAQSLLAGDAVPSRGRRPAE